MSGAAPRIWPSVLIPQGSSASPGGRPVKVTCMCEGQKGGSQLRRSANVLSTRPLVLGPRAEREDERQKTKASTMRLRRSIVRQELQRARRLSSVGRRTIKNQRRRTRGKVTRMESANVSAAVPITTRVLHQRLDNSSPDLDPSPSLPRIT